MYFFLLSMWVEKLISTPEINTFWPNSTPGNEKLDLLSNPTPEPEYPYLSISAFSVKVTAPNKQFFNVGSSIWELDAPNHKKCKYLPLFYDYM